ncbi:MAG: hypothetical protein KGZ51_07600 [Erysipelothrix sp.]|jgi:hypothetical protein|nr:hypothetical protein [Erysipelothrix sp.]
MNRKILVSLIFLVVLSVSLFFAHRYYTKPSISVNQSLFYQQIGYSQLQEDIKSSLDVQAYFLCEAGSDCDYVSFTLMKPILNKYQIPYFTTVKFVDMNDVSRQVSSTRLKELYNIQGVPALILIDTSNSSVIATLEYSKSAPLTQEMIEEWLLTYNLIR